MKLHCNTYESKVVTEVTTGFSQFQQISFEAFWEGQERILDSQLKIFLDIPIRKSFIKCQNPKHLNLYTLREYFILKCTTVNRCIHTGFYKCTHTHTYTQSICP